MIKPGSLICFFCICLISIQPCSATDIEISNVSFTGDPTNKTNPSLIVYLTVSWANAWHSDKNKDGAWLFFKLNHQSDIRSQRHAYVKKQGHSLVHNYLNNAVKPDFFVPDHAAGVVVYPGKKYRGTLQWRMKIELDVSKISGIDFSNVVFGRAFGVEMVYIPEGPFYAGDADTLQQNQGSAFYDFSSKDFFEVKSERALAIGKEAGELYYHNRNISHYRGDTKGMLSDSFPKGYKPFWIMKYELTQGQYSDFLNSISNTPAQYRANFGGKAYYGERGSIRFAEDRYVTDHPQRPANYISWDDGCAFADWAGLRPFTELEYEKACRGTKKPVSADYPWGTASREKVSRFYNEEGDLVLEEGLSEKDLSDQNLEFFSASVNWVMDLSGSVWECVVSVGSEKGRSFKGTHGDGRLTDYGNATNEDWPSNTQGGLGYRGSGFYGFGMRGDPFHNVSARPFAAWGEGPRSVGYGFRAALSGI